MAATVWTIAGNDYDVTFTDNLSTDGTLTVSGLTLVPEPGAFALLGGLVAMAFTLVRRRRSSVPVGFRARCPWNQSHATT